MDCPPTENWDHTTPAGHVWKLNGSYLGTVGGRSYFRALRPEAPADRFGDTVIEFENLDAKTQARVKVKDSQLPGYFAQDSLHWVITTPATAPANQGQLDLDGVRLGMTDVAALAALKSAGYEISPVRTVLTVASEVKLGVIAARKEAPNESFYHSLERRTLQVDASRYRDADGALVTDPIRLGRRPQYAQVEALNIWFHEDVSAGAFTTVVTTVNSNSRITGALPAKGTVEPVEAFKSKFGPPLRNGNWQRFFGNPDVPEVAGIQGFREVLTPQGTLRADEFTKRLEVAAREAIAARVTEIIQKSR